MRGIGVAGLALSLWAGVAHGALEEWSCRELATVYGVVAIDRDAGVDKAQRIREMVRAIIKSENSEALYIEADDANALTQIVAFVYDTPQWTPRQHMTEANNRCLRGQREAPQILPTGGRRA